MWCVQCCSESKQVPGWLKGLKQMLFIKSIFVMVSFAWYNSDNNGEKEIATLDMCTLYNIISESLQTQAYICTPNSFLQGE